MTTETFRAWRTAAVVLGLVATWSVAAPSSAGDGGREFVGGSVAAYVVSSEGRAQVRPRGGVWSFRRGPSAASTVVVGRPPSAKRAAQPWPGVRFAFAPPLPWPAPGVTESALWTELVVVTELKGLAQTRASEDDRWQRVTVGTVLPLGAEVRIGVRSRLTLLAPPDGDQSLTIDRLGRFRLSELSTQPEGREPLPGHLVPFKPQRRGR